MRRPERRVASVASLFLSVVWEADFNPDLH